MNRTWILGACCAIVLAALAAACGGGDGDKTGDATITEGTPSPGANVTPFPTPKLEGNNIVSESKGYSATLPDGWKPRFNLIQTVDASADAYFEPLAPGATVQASIAVTCGTDHKFAPQERIELVKTTTTRLGLNKDIQVAERQIDGAAVTSLSYTQESQQNPDQPKLAKTDFLFSGKKCDYTISTVSEVSDRAKYQSTFDAFIASFKYDK